MKKNLIQEIKVNSIAEEIGIEAGDYLLSINGSTINDIIEYKYLITDEELILEIDKNNDEIWEIEIQKDYDEDLGIIFENSIIDKTKGCNNKCMFCFVDQLPQGLRESLYFKDDDTRLSFLQGNYVTMTNMKEEEIERIIKYRIHPINISVHTTNPLLRQRMLNNKNAGKIMDIIDRFSEAHLTINTQIVLCPGVNDGVELERTIEDLSKFFPWVQAVTVVPVGITKFRSDLYPLREFTKSESIKTMEIISKFQDKMLEKHRTRFVFPGDEFFIKSQIEFPEYDYYEGFSLLENGVGMVTLFMDQINRKLEEIKKSTPKTDISIATGKLAYPYINKIVKKISEKWEEINIRVFLITNDFFGEKITVSGLITGQDIMTQLKGKKLGNKVLIPRSMLKNGSNIFLDDYTVEKVSKCLNIPVIPVEVEGEKLIEEILTIHN